MIGLAAWPRGAAGQLAQSLADAIKACGDLVAATVERRLRPVGLEQLSRLRSRARAKTLRADGVLAVFLTERPKAEEIALWEQMSVFVHTRWYGAEMLARQSVASPPPEAADLVDALVDRVHELHAPIPRSRPRSAGARHRLRCARRSTSTASTDNPASWRHTRPRTIPGPSAAWSRYCERAR